MVENIVEKKKKGFIAIDLDGTALVQKFDKNKWYGLTHSRSDLRQSLVEYMSLAQEEGYDIVILTARPQIVEPILSMGVGTKSTEQIVSELADQGINVAQIVRASPKGLKEGLKGDSMEEMLSKYKRENNNDDAIGILFDDQLKQVKDVRKKGDSNLIAYDINSVKDLTKYCERMGREYVKTEAYIAKNNGSVIQESIDLFLKGVEKMDESRYPQEVYVLSKIGRDLEARLKESEKCEYQPEIDWVKKAVESLGSLTNKLINGEKISYGDIENASQKVLEKSDPSAGTPNTKCERTIRSCLIYMNRLPVLEDIQAKCEGYKSHLNSVYANSGEPGGKTEQKLKIIDTLLEKLGNNNPTLALEEFQKEFEKKADELKTLRDVSGSFKSFIEVIRLCLAKVPVFGELFKVEEEKLVDAVNAKSNSTNHADTERRKQELDRAKGSGNQLT